MLNEYLEGVYRYRNISFEEMSIKDLKLMHETCLGLVHKLSQLAVEDNQRENNFFLGDNPSL